ncbi:BsuPI-related putative proteinase inhibitor [Halorubrum ejinorense]|uniref:BsuPI-related putative proteinase inhibitor n=1 Tax=Halorubrum ejinorense TaxID=425309 RepID=UPI0031DB1529
MLIAVVAALGGDGDRRRGGALAGDRNRRVGAGHARISDRPARGVHRVSAGRARRRERGASPTGGDSADPIWRYGAARTFTQALGSETIAPGESVAYERTWRHPPAETALSKYIEDDIFLQSC